MSLWRAWCCHRRGKRRRPAIAEFDVDADRHLLALARELQAGSYHPHPYRQKLVYDPKLRLVSAPALRDRILHQSLVSELAPHFERRYIDDSYACRPARGPHRAVLRFLGFARTYRHYLRLDIRRYFQSIAHTILLSLWEHRIADAQTLELLQQLTEHGGDVYRTRLAIQTIGISQPGAGVPVGSSLSQWAANLYLDGLDHYVKRELKVRGYLPLHGRQRPVCQRHPRA